jgi:hypothetical protein
VNFGWQSVSDRFTDTKTFELYQETARYSSEYDIESNTTFDIGGAAHIWRGLGAGVAVTRFEDARDIAIEGTLPHPFFFRTDRAVSGTTPGTREELATHVSATYFIPAGRRMQVVVFGGPSIFNVQQTVVTELKYTQQFPYDSVAFSPPTVVTEKETKVGYHVGADVAYYFSKVVGAGGIVRFSRASVPFSLGDRDAGGVSVGGGLRLRFP